MIDLSADALVGFEVGGVEVADELEGGFEVCLDDVESEFEYAKSFFDVVQLAADPFLLAFEEVERERTGVVGFEELGSLVEGSTLPGDELLPIGAGVLAKLGDPFEDHLLSLEAQVLAEFDGLVVVDDGLLDVLDQERPLAAAARTSLSTDADEVRVYAL